MNYNPKNQEGPYEWPATLALLKNDKLSIINNVQE